MMDTKGEQEIKKTISRGTYEMLMIDLFGKINPQIKDVVKRSYRDMAAHTLKKENYTDNEKEELYDKTAPEIVDWIDRLQMQEVPKTEESFDEWHENLCAMIMGNYGNNGFSCGQAQKWVNMVLKYLYMFDVDGYDGIKEYKQFLHVPLDRKVLECIFEENMDKGPEKVLGWKKSTIPAWSKLPIYEDYKKILNVVRMYCKEIGEIPCEWEINAWNEKSGK